MVFLKDAPQFTVTRKKFYKSQQGDELVGLNGSALIYDDERSAQACQSLK